MRGVLLTLKQMGAKYLFNEMLRRLLGKNYLYNGIVIRDAATFRLVGILVSRGSVWRQGDLVYFRNRLGILPYMLKTSTSSVRLRRRTSKRCTASWTSGAEQWRT